MISVSTVGKIIEYEIKISTRDFRADRTKRKKHDALDQRMTLSKRGLPNYFVYVCPPGIIEPEEVPNYAGLWWVSRKGVEIKKREPVLHRGVITSKQVRTMMKAQMWRIWLKLYAPPGWRPKKVRKTKKKRGKKRRKR